MFVLTNCFFISFYFPKDSLNIALVAGCAAGGAVLFGLILCAVTALVVRKKRKKVKLEAPEYAKFMFWPGIFPFVFYQLILCSNCSPITTKGAA